MGHFTLTNAKVGHSPESMAGMPSWPFGFLFTGWVCRLRVARGCKMPVTSMSDVFTLLPEFEI